MARDLLRVLGLWRDRAGWLALGAGTAIASALLGLSLLLLAGQAVAGRAAGASDAGAFALGGGAVALLLLRPLVLLRPASRWVERMVSHAATSAPWPISGFGSFGGSRNGCRPELAGAVRATSSAA